MEAPIPALTIVTSNPRAIRSPEAPSLPDLVHRELRAAILNGVFAPGQVLRQEEVANRLGVSRSPLREALPRLEAEGIVVLQPRRGYSVVRLDPKDIIEAFDLRFLLERELARRAIVLRTAADIALTQRLLGEMRACTRIDSEWFELNSEFHRALLAPAQRPHHLRALSVTQGASEVYVRAEVRLTGDVEQADFEHALIADAFAAGEPEGFLRLLRDHAEHTRIRLLEGLAEQQRRSDDAAGRRLTEAV